MQSNSDKLNFEFPTFKSHDRLWHLILYLAKASESDLTFGKTKLAKILYFSDFTSFIRYGTPITGTQYIKLEKGPVPDVWSDLLREMESSGAISVKAVPLHEYTQLRVVAHHEADLTLFTGRDIKLVDEVMLRLLHMSAKELSELSHNDIAWKIARLNEPIPYQASILSNEEITQEDIAHVQRLIQEYGVDP
jgi:uncharacterized phage-associated protein